MARHVHGGTEKLYLGVWRWRAMCLSDLWTKKLDAHRESAGCDMNVGFPFSILKSGSLNRTPRFRPMRLTNDNNEVAWRNYRELSSLSLNPPKKEGDLELSGVTVSRLHPILPSTVWRRLCGECLRRPSELLRMYTSTCVFTSAFAHADFTLPAVNSHRSFYEPA